MYYLEGTPGGTLIFSYNIYVGSDHFGGFSNSILNSIFFFFWGGGGGGGGVKMNIFWGMIKFWTFLGVITKLNYFGGHLYTFPVF